MDVQGSSTELILEPQNSMFALVRVREEGFDRSVEGHQGFFCGKWGCETTGQAYWNPSSTWDLITVKWGSNSDGPNQGERNSSKYPENRCAYKNSPSGPCKGKDCNPMLIKFTGKGRQDHHSWFKGTRWG